MPDRTEEKIKADSEASISAMSVYLNQTVPEEQFGSNMLGRIGNIKPIASPEDTISSGLIGQDGLITPKGSLVSALMTKGLLNRDGTPTELGTALVIDEDDALRRKNLKLWQLRQANRVNEAESVTIGESLGQVGEYIWNAGAGLGTMIKQGLSIPVINPINEFDNMDKLGIKYDPKLREEAEKKEQTRFNRNSVGAVAFQEGSLKAISEMGSMINLGVAAANQAIIENFYPAKLAEQYRNTDAIDEARQAQARLVKSNQDAALGTTLDAVVQSVDYLVNLAQKPSTMPIGTFEGQQTPVKLYADEMARAKSEMPKAEFDKLVKQTTAAGEVFQDPAELLQLGTVAKLAFRPVTSRVILNADRIISKSIQRGADIAGLAAEKADIDNALGIVQNTTDLSKKLADDLRARYDVTGDQSLLRRATVADEIFNRGTAKIQQFTADGVRITDNIANLTAESEKLSTKIPLAAAQTFEAAAKAGRELKAVPFKTFAAIIEPVGLGLMKLDDGLNSVSKKFGIEGAYNLLTSKVGQTIGYGAAAGLGPVPAVIGAAGTILNSGPFLQRLADTSRILGTEMAKAQSQMPFFQRVANYSNLSPAHRALATLADTATMGGFLPDIARRAVRGTALSFPADFVGQYMSDGGQVNENTFKQAFAESLLLGGSSAALGGIFAGTKKRHRDLSVGDEINFKNEITSPDQKRIFSQAPSHLRRAIGTFSAVFPSMNVQLTESGGGFHDDNTIGIDVNSSNPLKYLLAHEVKHLLVHRNQMHNGIVAMMLGDGETGGLMRAPDGTLNPEFEAFAKEYNSRQISAGRQPVSLGKIAEEFFVEAGVEDMAGMAESGALGVMASRTEARRMIGNLFNAALDKSTVLKDFHLKIGGLMDQGGKLVQGNGLLDPGITQTQEMRNMTKNMLSRAAGRSVGQFEPLGAANVGNKGEGPGINLPINPDDKAMIEKIGPVEFEMETVNGVRQVARDSSGNPIPVDFNTQLMRSRTGALIQEAIGNRPSTYQVQPGEMHLNDEGIWEGHLPPDIIEHIKKKGSLNQEQIRMVEHVNGMIKKFKGDVAMVINHPATSRNKKGKINYKTLKATLRQVVPISWNLTKDGNLTLGLMSVTQLKANVDSRISSKMGQKLYQGNRAKLMIDVGRVMELHNKGQRTDAYFDSEYGAAKSQQYKNFVNSVFGLITKKQGEANPIFSEENLRGNSVYKTYRADRISQATKMTGDKYPFQYDFVVQNMMPNGMPTLDDQGRPVAQNRLPEPINENNKQIEETGRVPSEQGIPTDRGTAVQAQEGTALGEGQGQEGQVNRLPEPVIGGNGKNENPDPLQKAPGKWTPDPLKSTVEQAKIKGIPQEITSDVLSFIKDKPIVVGMADLLGAGGKVRDITVTGGPGYPVLTFNPKDPNKITSVWVSQRQGIKTILENMVKTDAIWQDETGHHWAIYAPHTMKQDSHKSNSQTPLVYISKVEKFAERGALSQDSIKEISDNIRKNIPMAKDMPDLGDKKLNKFIENAAFETRAAIMSELTTARSRDLGAPAPESVLTETRDVQYHGVEENSITSLLLIDIDRMAKKDQNGKWQLRDDLSASDFGVDKHPSYDTAMPGRILSHFQNPVPFRIAAPEMLKTMASASPASRPDFLLTRMPAGKGIRFQTMTENLASQINNVQKIGINVPQIRETVLAATGNWKKFTSGQSTKGLTEFLYAIDRSPAKESLSKYEKSSLQKMIKSGEMNVYQLGSNDIWFGVKTVPGKNGKPATKDLVSVVNNTGIPGMLSVIMARALEAGVNTLDASAVINAKSPNGFLPSLYSRYGWVETERVPYDRKYLVERDPNDTLKQHKAKIDQKEAALKMFWEEQGWDGKSMPDIVYMEHKGKQNGITIGKHQEGVATTDAETIRASADETSGEIRGAGLTEGRNQTAVGGAPTGDLRSGEGELPRGFDSVIENLRGASDIQVEAMGLTNAQVDKFLQMHGYPARSKTKTP